MFHNGRVSARGPSLHAPLKHSSRLILCFHKQQQHWVELSWGGEREGMQLAKEESLQKNQKLKAGKRRCLLGVKKQEETRGQSWEGVCEAAAEGRCKEDRRGVKVIWGKGGVLERGAIFSDGRRGAEAIGHGGGLWSTWERELNKTKDAGKKGTLGEGQQGWRGDLYLEACNKGGRRWWEKRKRRAGGTAGGARGDAGEGEHRAPVSYNYYSLGCFSRPGDNRGEGETHVWQHINTVIEKSPPDKDRIRVWSIQVKENGFK